MTTPEVFQIGIPVYDLVNLMDIAAPCEMFFWMNLAWQSQTSKQKSVEVSLVAATTAAVATIEGVPIIPKLSFADCPQLDLLWVPGGYPTALKDRMNDPVFLNFLREQSKGAKFVTSVCEGALLLASAGLLDGYKATTHWAFISCLRKFKKIKVARGYPRYVVNQRKDSGQYIVTGGGIASGLDESLELVRLISDQVLGPDSGIAVAKQVQLNTQYLPKPPFKVKITGSKQCPLDSVG
ncbi:MAG TPA: DJ-1/PfpI family protein [Pyrinomonadaceae bacterium]|nr:DJ-1/PfpI family protein [Pyrinomonadaceae bacterium]